MNTFLIDRVEAFHALEAKFGCKMRIYGSVATGSARPDSDVDVLVVFDGEGDQWALWYDLGLLFEKEVDVVIEKNLIPVLRDRIIKEARTIDQLIAGDRPPVLQKSPYLYLSSIEKLARRIRRVRGPCDVQRDAIAFNAMGIGKMALRLRETCPDFVSGVPIKSIQPFIRTNKRLENNYQAKLSRRDVATARKLARHICKRLSLDQQFVIEQINGIR